MKKFKGARKLDDIIRLAEEKGFEVDQTELEKGEDWIWLRDMDGRMMQIMYNVCNGTFFAYRPIPENEPWATERSEELDNDPEYCEILDLLYLPA